MSLVTEEVVESLKKQIVEAGNLTLSTVHDTRTNESHFYDFEVKVFDGQNTYKMQPRSLPELGSIGRAGSAACLELTKYLAKSGYSF